MKILAEKMIANIRDVAAYYSEMQDQITELQKERDHFYEGLRRLSNPDVSPFSMLSSTSQIAGAKMGVESAAKVARKYLGEQPEDQFEFDWFELYFARGEEISRIKSELMTYWFGLAAIPKNSESWAQALLTAFEGLDRFDLSSEQIAQLRNALSKTVLWEQTDNPTNESQKIERDEDAVKV